VTLPEFRRLVQLEFGGDLGHMTPANAREFLDRVQTHAAVGEGPARRFHLNEPEGTYEAIVRDFLRQSLTMPPDEAVIRLWLYCLELASSHLSEVESEKFHRLFAGISLGDGAE